MRTYHQISKFLTVLSFAALTLAATPISAKDTEKEQIIYLRRANVEGCSSDASTLIYKVFRRGEVRIDGTFNGESGSVYYRVSKKINGLFDVEFRDVNFKGSSVEFRYNSVSASHLDESFSNQFGSEAVDRQRFLIKWFEKVDQQIKSVPKGTPLILCE